MQAHEPGTVWTVTQLWAFVTTARQHRLFAFFHLATYTGARRGELLNLHWEPHARKRSYRTPGYTICGICTPQPCCSPGCRGE